VPDVAAATLREDERTGLRVAPAAGTRQCFGDHQPSERVRERQVGRGYSARWMMIFCTSDVPS
jgi:hypothetical protein